jgi:hypothetical protein
LVSTVFSFVTPVIIVAGTLAMLHTAGYIPGFSWITQIGTSQIWGFLAVFGSGCPLQGMFTIGIAFAVVGSLFDLFNFSLYQGVKNHSHQSIK